MTSREIILANLEHADPERIGLNFTGEGRINDMVSSGLGPSRTYQERRWVDGPMEYYDDPWGNIWRRMVDGSRGGEVHEAAIREWSQLDTLELPDFDDPARYEKAARIYAQHPDKYHVGFVPGWVFATSRYLRKMEIYFADLIAYPKEIDRLHTLVTDLFVRVIRLYAEAGADAVFYCEDLGTQQRALIGPKMWRQVFRPHYERLTSTAHELGLKVLMHSCGYNWQLIDDLIAAGIDCFQFDQPEVYDLPALAGKLEQHQVALWSPVDIQQIMPKGDKELIEAEVAKMVELFGGFLILKNYGDIAGIGIEQEWDRWAYEAALRAAGIEPVTA